MFDADAIIEAEMRRTQDIHEHLRFMCDLAVAIQARTIVELGVRSGCSTVALLCAAVENDGQVYSVDIEPCPEAVNHVNALGLSSRWTFVVANDLDWAALCPEPVDLLLIDTTHERAHTEAELRAFALKVRSGGAILVHDTVSGPYSVSPDVGPNVLAAINAFLRDTPAGTWTFENRPNCYGLGVLTRKGRL